MGLFRPTAAVLAAALISSPLLSYAQPKPPTDAQKAQVSELVKKAIAKSQANDHAGAIEIYQQAYGIVPVPVLLNNIASEYLAANKNVEALDFFCKYLEADPTGNAVTYATAKAKALAMELRHVSEMDDKNVCKPPEAEKPPIEAGTGSGSGSGEQTTGTEGLNKPAPAKPVASESDGGGLRTTGYIVGTVGVLIAAAGGYYVFKSKQLSDDENNHPKSKPWPSQIDGVNLADIQSTGSTYNNRAYTLGIAGGVAVVAGGVLLYLGYSKKGSSSAEHARLTPVVTQNSAGLALSGGF
jgi:hypothetical protein